MKIPNLLMPVLNILLSLCLIPVGLAIGLPLVLLSTELVAFVGMVWVLIIAIGLVKAWKGITVFIVIWLLTICSVVLSLILVSTPTALSAVIVPASLLVVLLSGFAVLDLFFLLRLKELV